MGAMSRVSAVAAHQSGPLVLQNGPLLLYDATRVATAEEAMTHYDKAVYWQRKSRGQCPTCGVAVTDGFVNCGKCRAEHRKYTGSKAERPALKRPYGSRPNQYSLQWKLNKQRGLCGCGAEVREGTTYHGKAYTTCDECYEYHRQHNQAYMQRQREAKSGRV